MLLYYLSLNNYINKIFEKEVDVVTFSFRSKQFPYIVISFYI